MIKILDENEEERYLIEEDDDVDADASWCFYHDKDFDS